MSKAMKVAFALALGSLVIAVPSIWAYWVGNGVALCTATGDQLRPAIGSDGAGGAIIAWNDYRNSNTDIYAQRVSASGEVLWTANGVALCTMAFDQQVPAIVSDGAGGAIVAWHDYRTSTSWDIYAQRVDASGAVQWAANGVVLCAGTGDQLNPKIVSDGVGGAIITWHDYRSGSNYDVYAQRVNASGVVQWTANGVAVCAAANGQLSLTTVSDGAGGALVAWQDYRNGSNYDIYAQRVSNSGVAQWTVDGVALCTVAWNQQYPTIASDGTGGAIVTWYDYRSANYDIYAQRVNASGVVQWTTTGVALCTATGAQYYPVIVSDDAGGAIVSWYDYRNGSNYDIYAQKLDASGVVQWIANGIAVCTATGTQYYPVIASDVDGGAIISWFDARSGIYDIYAQRVNPSGAVQWAADGVALCTAAQTQEYPVIASDNRGGAIVAWSDYRDGNGDIYVQFIDTFGRTGMLSPEIHTVRDVPGDQGGKVYLSWYAARPDLFMTGDMSYYSIWRAISPTQAALALDSGVSPLASLSELDTAADKPVVRVEQIGALTYFWELVETVDALYMEAYGKPVATLFDSTAACGEYHYFQVVAHTSDPFVFWKSAPDSGYSVDNLAPTLPLGLAAEQSYVPDGLELSWDGNTEADLAGYRVYRGIAEDFIPDEGNLIASPEDTICFDAGWSWSVGYYYKVSAVDIHGNESGFAILAPEQITGGETPPPPEASYLAQNYPNPFNPMTRVEFGLGTPARVSLRIYDPAGRLVRALVEEHRTAGRYTEIWDGCDASGRAVASGVYFYRLETGAYSETKKMVLAR